MPSQYPGVIVASYGRSGSTLLYRAAVDAMCEARFGKYRSFVAEHCWTLADNPLRTGIVYKTHDYPGALEGRDDLRTLFVFGSAIDSVLSVLEQDVARGREWIEEHLEHLKSKDPFEALLQRDILGIGAQLDAWTTFEGSPVLCVRYDALWEAEAAIQDFAQIPLTLPERRPRTEKDVAPDVRAAVESLYGPIDDRINALPDVFVAGAQVSATTAG